MSFIAPHSIRRTPGILVFLSYIEIAKFSTILRFGKIPSLFRSPETNAIPNFFASARVLIEEKSTPWFVLTSATPSAAGAIPANIRTKSS